MAINLEDNRAASVLSAIDFSKAFNQLEHEYCLKSIIKKGASNQLVGVLSAFLSGRSMRVKVGTELLDARPVNAGAPQGSILGCFLFNLGVDDLEEDFVYKDENSQDEHTETLTRTDDYPVFSAPTRVRPGLSEPSYSPVAGQVSVQQVFEIRYRVANVPPYLKKPKDPRFVDNDIATYKFVDDQVNVDKINMREIALLMDGNKPVKNVHAKKS